MANESLLPHAPQKNFTEPSHFKIFQWIYGHLKKCDSSDNFCKEKSASVHNFQLSIFFVFKPKILIEAHVTKEFKKHWDFFYQI